MAAREDAGTASAEGAAAAPMCGGRAGAAEPARASSGHAGGGGLEAKKGNLVLLEMA